MNKPIWNSDLNDWEVCTVCLEVINDVFEDHPTIAEEMPDENEDTVEEQIGRYNWTKPLGGEPTVVESP
jgi:hypothetical protein